MELDHRGGRVHGRYRRGLPACWITLPGVLLVCGLLAAVVVAINRSLRHALGGDPEYAADVAAQIANNDLSGVVRTHANDRHSVLYAMKTMQANLVDAISEIRHSAETIATASSEIASGNMDLSARRNAGQLTGRKRRPRWRN